MKVGPFEVADFRPDADGINFSVGDHALYVWVDEHGDTQVEISGGEGESLEVHYATCLNSYNPDEEE